MLQVLGNRIYRRLFLFLAQAVALLGTGLATVALGLLAYELAGEDAGVVLGTALAIKMVAYVGTAPVAAGFAESLPRHRLLVGLDLLRAAVALSLSRLAYDLESLASPMAAAALLTVVGFHVLFAGTALGFLASAALVASVALPHPRPSERRGIYDRTTCGLRICLATPRLRGGIYRHSRAYVTDSHHADWPHRA